MKEEKRVLINLLAIAHYDQMPDYPIQMMTIGKLQTLPDGQMILRYQENEPDDEDGPTKPSDITLFLSPKRVTMERRGEFNNTMVFAKGQRFEGIYSTPYGDMPMAVFSREATARFRDGRGAVHLQYDLEFQGGLASTNELHLEFFQEEKHSKGGKTHEKADQ